MEYFDYSVSNPPYQVEAAIRSSGQFHFSTIYDDFQKLALVISKNSCMIYPANWQNSFHQGFGKWLNNNGIKNSKFYWAYELFGNAIRANYPISIVMCSKGYIGKIEINSITTERNLNVWIDTELKKIVYEKISSFSSKMFQGANHISELNNIDSFPNIAFNKSSINKDDVKIYIKKSISTAPDGGDYYISKDNALKNFNQKDIDEYIVAIQWRFFVQNQAFIELAQKPELGLSLRIFDKNYVFGKTWVKLNSFKTNDEALNFYNYMNVKIIIIASTFEKSMKKFGSFVPDFEDYTNNNPIFKSDEELGSEHEYYGLTLDERLYKLFKLTDEEIEIVKSEK